MELQFQYSYSQSHLVSMLRQLDSLSKSMTRLLFMLMYIALGLIVSHSFMLMYIALGLIVGHLVDIGKYPTAIAALGCIAGLLIIEF